MAPHSNAAATVGWAEQREAQRCRLSVLGFTAFSPTYALRWLVEEWRVSVFAQELKTAEPVSGKRMAQALSAIKQH